MKLLRKPRPRQPQKAKLQLDRLNFTDKQFFFESRLSAGLGQQGGKVFLAAVSGGADSVAMLSGLAALREDAGFNLFCVHVEHGLRPAAESSGDARAVKILCKKLNVPCRIVSVPPGKIAAFAGSRRTGIEAAARFFRHRIFDKERERLKADWVLTGHTRDDALETLLMRILRGSGPAGLALMPRTRAYLLRPLLDLTRGDIIEYLEARGLSYRTDSTNKDTVFLRNKIRLRLIPFLDELFPSWRSSLFSLGETQALAAAFIKEEAGKGLPWEPEAGGLTNGTGGPANEAGGPLNEAGGSLSLREEDFFKAPQILREEAVFAGVDMLTKAGSLQKPPRRAALRRAVSAELKEGAASDLGPLRLERQNGFIRLSPSQKNSGDRAFSLLIKEAGLYTLKGRQIGGPKGIDKFPNLLIRSGQAKDGGYSFAAKLPLVLRNHREGDRILRGGHKLGFSDIIKSKDHDFLGLIIALDADGPAAFIAFERRGDFKIIGRDCTVPGDDYHFFELSLETEHIKRQFSGV